MTCLRRSLSRGLTLAEIVLAMGILAFVALTVVGVFLALLQTSAKNREQAMAELLTESLLEKATTVGPPTWGVDRQIGTRLEAQLESDGSRFFYQVEPVRVAAHAGSGSGQAWRVTVTVGWWQAQQTASLQTARVGFGHQYVRGVRTVYWRDGELR